MRFRPCIDLHNNKVKQIVGSTLRDDDSGLKTNFVSEYSPAYYAKLYQKDNLTGGHVIMLGPGNESAAREALQAWPGGLQVGGGITPGNASEYLDAGAAQVIVTSYLIEKGELSLERLETLHRTVPREKLVIDLSCRQTPDGFKIVFDRWQRFTSTLIDGKVLAMLGDFCTEFLIHAVDNEGKMSGVNTELIRLLGEISPIPCVYAGGISTLEHIDLIRKFGNHKIDFTVGSALDLFGGKLPYALVKEER